MTEEYNDFMRDVDNESSGMRPRKDIEKLLRSCDRFLLGESREISGFPFHGLKNTGQITIMGLRHILSWVLGKKENYRGAGITYEDFRKEDIPVEKNDECLGEKNESKTN